MTYSFSYLEPVCCPTSSSNSCFLTCIQVSQEAGQVAWYSHLLQNFSQFIVIHTVEGFGVVNKAEIDVFLELSCFFNDPTDIDNLISGSSAFSKPGPVISCAPSYFSDRGCVNLLINQDQSLYLLFYLLSISLDSEFLESRDSHLFFIYCCVFHA